MPQITPATLVNLRTAISLLFAKGREAAKPVWSKLATKVTSSTKSMHFPRHAALSRGMRRWEGDRRAVSGKTYDYIVTAEKFEFTVEIDVDDIEDDNIGAYSDIIMNAGDQIELWPDDLVFEQLLHGESADPAYAAYDGKPFFANDHELKAGRVIDNLVSGALTKDNLAAAIARMMSWVGEDGRSLRRRPTALWVPPALADQGEELVGMSAELIAKVFGSNTAAAAVNNTMRGKLTLEVMPELAADAGGSDADWYVAVTDKPTKPIVLVERQAPKLVVKGDMDDDNVFFEDKVIVGAKARGAAGWGDFTYALKSKG